MRKREIETARNVVPRSRVEFSSEVFGPLLTRAARNSDDAMAVWGTQPTWCRLRRRDLLSAEH